ncbi:MAG: hypothetical protein AAFN70_21385, partial [Planctomycetota bacterium]
MTKRTNFLQMSRTGAWRIAFLVLGVFSATVVAGAEDWAQGQGMRRDNKSNETGLLKSWPEGGPKLAWTFRDCGVGYSGPAIVGQRIYIMGGRKGR